ncbi:MAG: alkaline phosphatase family protein [Candidatus Bathycorpusculaceae bacterium]
MAKKDASPTLKLIYVIVDGMGDLPIKELGDKTPLEVAETPNMDSLAKKGKTGLMYTVKKGVAPESDVAVISILGYDPFKYSTGRGVLEAIGAGLTINNGNLALRCNFATLGHGRKIIDRRAGRNLTTEEAAELSKAANEKVKLESYPADFEFKSTLGHRAVLVLRSRDKPLSSNITNTDPAYSRLEGLGVAEAKAEMLLRKCEPIDRTEEAKAAANLVNEFTEKSHKIWDKHEINRTRAAKRKLKANVILTRDAANLLPKFPNINEKYNAQFVSLTDMPVERGISKLVGMQTVAIPPPTQNLRKDCESRAKHLLGLLPDYDCFYIHIKGPDEPGHDGNFNLKASTISMIDKYFFGRVLPNLNPEEFVICVTSDHSTPCELKAHSDDPVPVLISGDKIRGDNLAKFSERECRNGSLGTLKRGTELMPQLISLIKS